MKQKSSDREPEPPGGRAAERLREFIEQRFPGGVPLPAGLPQPEEDALDAENAEEPAAPENPSGCGESEGDQKRRVTGRKKRQAPP